MAHAAEAQAIAATAAQHLPVPGETRKDDALATVTVEVEVAACVGATDSSPVQPTPPAGWRPWSDLAEDERECLFAAAQQGDTEALRHVLWALAVEPERGAKILDVPRQIRRNMISSCGMGREGRNNLAREATEAQCEMVRADLMAACSGGPGGGSALERLLVERIVTCWLAAYLADGDAASVTAGHSWDRSAEFYLKRQDRAHRRLVQSIECLARVQRLMRPGPLVAAMTMAQQVNIAQPGAAQVNLVTSA